MHRWTVASYLGHVGGERCLSPPTRPGYEAKVDRNTDSKSELTKTLNKFGLIRILGLVVLGQNTGFKSMLSR